MSKRQHVKIGDEIVLTRGKTTFNFRGKRYRIKDYLYELPNSENITKYKSTSENKAGDITGNNDGSEGDNDAFIKEPTPYIDTLESNHVNNIKFEEGNLNIILGTGSMGQTEARGERQEAKGNQLSVSPSPLTLSPFPRVYVRLKIKRAVRLVIHFYYCLSISQHTTG